MFRYDYDGLAVLSAVIREGSFEAAAKILGVTQSAVSQRIRQLEEKAGAVLVVRARPCVPTEAGMQLCRHMDQVSLLQHEVVKRMDLLVGREDASVASIRIAVNNDSLATWFPTVVKRVSEELGLRFDVIPDDQEHTENSLKSGDALAAVTSSDAPVQGCRRVSLGSMEYLAVAAPDYHQKVFSDGVSLKTLQNSDCLAFDRKDTIQHQWMEEAFGNVVEVGTHFVPSYEGYLACCLNGTAWGLVASNSCREEIDNGNLIELVPGKSVKVALHWQASAHSSEMLRRLTQIIEEEARDQLLPDRFRP